MIRDLNEMLRNLGFAKERFSKNEDITINELISRVEQNIDSQRMGNMTNLLSNKYDKYDTKVVVSDNSKEYITFVRGLLRISNTYKDDKLDSTNITILGDNNVEYNYIINNNGFSFIKTHCESNMIDANIIDCTSFIKKGRSVTYQEDGYCGKTDVLVSLNEVSADNYQFTFIDTKTNFLKSSTTNLKSASSYTEFLLYESSFSVKHIADMLDVLDGAITGITDFIYDNYSEMKELISRYKIKKIVLVKDI